MRSWEDVKVGDVVVWNGRRNEVASKGAKAFSLAPVGTTGVFNTVKRAAFEYDPRNEY